MTAWHIQNVNNVRKALTYAWITKHDSAQSQFWRILTFLYYFPVQILFYQIFITALWPRKKRESAWALSQQKNDSHNNESHWKWQSLRVFSVARQFTEKNVPFKFLAQVPVNQSVNEALPALYTILCFRLDKECFYFLRSYVSLMLDRKILSSPGDFWSHSVYTINFNYLPLFWVFFIAFSCTANISIYLSCFKTM